MKSISKWLSNNLIRIYAFFAFTYLFIPVAYTFVFSFNDSRKTNLIWRGFTLDKWKNPCGAPDVCSALGNSFIIGLTATAISTVLGTLIAYALGRYEFKGRSSTNLLIFLPMGITTNNVCECWFQHLNDNCNNRSCDVLHLICGRHRQSTCGIS